MRIVKDRLAVQPGDFGRKRLRFPGRERVPRGERGVAADLDVEGKEITHGQDALLGRQHALAQRGRIAPVTPGDEPGPPRRQPTLHGDERRVGAVGGGPRHDP